MIKPQRLYKGDKVAIVSPAGALQNKEIIGLSIHTLAQWGLETVVAPHCLTSYGYYSATAEERAKDMRESLNDKTIKAVFCSFGGYGCVHLLDSIFEDIRCNPKWIIGMSDISAIHAASLSAGVMSLHSPSCRHLAYNGNDICSEYLRNILFGRRPHYKTEPHKLNRPGKVSGIITGGNLSVLTALVKSQYDIFKPGIVLFIEDINEPVYKIERMLYTLKFSGALKSISALIVGRFSGCKESLSFGGTLYEIIRNMVKEYDYPVCFDFPVGHVTECFPIIEGATVDLEIRTESVELSFRP